jgi:hypothetical protein
MKFLRKENNSYNTDCSQREDIGSCRMKEDIHSFPERALLLNPHNAIYFEKNIKWYISKARDVALSKTFLRAHNTPQRVGLRKTIRV